MNPLDKLEFDCFEQKLAKELPIHTQTSVKIPHSYKQLPKNLMDESARVDNNFLNNYQGMIEEILQRDKKNQFARDFKLYQIKYFSDYGILKGDGFYNIMPDFNEIMSIGLGKKFTLHKISHLSLGNGPLLTTGGTSATNTKSTGNIIAYPLSAGTIGQFYDQIAMDITTNVNNYRLGVYNDVSGLPSVLYSETASLPASTGFIFRVVKEFVLLTTANWVAHQQDADISVHTIAASRAFSTWTYGAFQNPMTGITTDNVQQVNMKVGHS